MLFYWKTIDGLSILEKILGSFMRFQAIKSNICSKHISRNSLEQGNTELIKPADSTEFKVGMMLHKHKEFAKESHYTEN